MKSLIDKIRKSLSLQISLWVLLFAVLIFVVSLGFLYIQTRNYIRQDAMQRAEKVLNNSVLEVTEMLNDVEIATNNTLWLVKTHPQPDSVVIYSRSIVELNPNFYSCSIAFEPYYFQHQGEGEFYSIYSYRKNGIIVSEQEGSDNYRYFDKDWYRLPRESGEAHWIDPFYDYYLDAASVKAMLTTYSKPITDAQGRFIGVVATDLSMQHISLSMDQKKPSPRSFFFMLDHKGTFCMHPDTAKIGMKTIFSDCDPVAQADVIALGQAMTSGKEGMRTATIDGENCYVFFRPLPRTGWSIAVAYPESEIFKGYNRLFYIVLLIIVIGLIFMQLICRHLVNNAIVPMGQLARQARYIATGNYSDHMATTARLDAVGRLQNSFVQMQQSIATRVSGIERLNQEIEQRNEELVRANELAQEADRKKTAFMQDITHQVRTPLNIITGFAQVMREGSDFISPDEMVTIIDAMQDNSYNIQGIIDKLLAASFLEGKEHMERNGEVECNALCRQLVATIRIKQPDTVRLDFTTSVPDSLTLHTHTVVLPKILRQMLDNANQFTTQGTINLHCQQPDPDHVQFIVTDTGIGIPEADRERIFEQFTKLNYYAEGLGIGLTLCRQAAELLGGTLILDPTYQTGARFIFTLAI